MDRPKLGLALSGGGFRASLFHIGVLARLAERNVLKDVEVLSTVSGGSILGAYYYLKVKQLLEGRHPDFPRPSREAYIAIVHEIERDFLAAVQKNLRTRALWNPYKTARMFLTDDYSRSDRMAELYDEHLYLPLWRKIRGAAGDEIPLKEIKIKPAGERDAPDPGEYNARAEYKIPNLVINATCLNTGHSWHFTSSWVGEPDPKQVTEHTIDTNSRLEPLRFDGRSAGDPERKKLREALSDAGREEARKRSLNGLTLADAVAASACVPGLFTPLAIHDLYWSDEGREIVVELVDGGVFDNQGIDALYSQDCTTIVCSDASGQLEDEYAPSSQAIPVAMRSNSVMMERLREDGFYDLFESEKGDKLLRERDPARAASEAARIMRSEWKVDKFAFFHLREEFDPQPGYPAIPGPVNRATASAGHVYRLSDIRTDLDSFSDIEAYSLMYDGYCLSNKWMSKKGIIDTGSLPARDGGDQRWDFLRITALLGTARQQELLTHLEVGGQQFFKVFREKDPLAIAAAAVIAGVIAWLGWHYRATAIAISPFKVTIGWLAGALAAVLLVWLLKKLESTRWMGVALEKIRWLRRGQWLAPLLVAIAIVLLVVSAAVTVHLLVFDPLFLRRGSLKPREQAGAGISR